ncbi:unnamed protein product [Strongylus vulgaris]|uniref:Uncharacterized protein n=1 Tax=Strongylus vulgaris TaxID=40348 RepID=A0A3P7I6B2_STRVU|nr:unnamed protein product [Strongylus vulgaris]
MSCEEALTYRVISENDVAQCRVTSPPQNSTFENINERYAENYYNQHASFPSQDNREDNSINEQENSQYDTKHNFQTGVTATPDQSQATSSVDPLAMRSLQSLNQGHYQDTARESYNVGKFGACKSIEVCCYTLKIDLRVDSSKHLANNFQRTKLSIISYNINTNGTA